MDRGNALESIVLRARGGDVDAFAALVHRFQDMAVGYGYSMLRDFQLAEDAAQEAYFEAYRSLPKLREPAAFPGWFRKIVFKQCDRILRRNAAATISLNDAPEQGREDKWDDVRDRVLEAVDSLPEHERAAALLFYIGGYSQNEVAAFLDTPVGAVKKRLYSARNRLRDMLADAVEDGLRSRRPSRDDRFAENVLGLLKAARAGDAPLVKEILQRDRRLLTARDSLGNTALIIAVNSGHSELAAMLMASGVEPDFHEAAAIGDLRRLETLLAASPDLLDSYSAEGFPAIGLAAHFGHPETVRFLLLKGADVNKTAEHKLGVTPLHAALFGRQRECARLLVESGADVTARRGGQGWARAGWTALHYAVSLGFDDLIPLLLERGADPEARDDEGKTPKEVR
jgi:RNA polymerase sigma factor (sigma-70 family)